MKHPIRKIIVIAVLIAAVLLGYNYIREDRYKKALNAQVPNAEHAEMLRAFGKYEEAAERAEYYQALADHDFAAGGQLFQQYGFDLSGGYYHELPYDIALECEDGDALLKALGEGFAPLIQPKAKMWELNSGSNFNNGPYYSLLCCKDTEALINACGAAPNGKLLVIYTENGVNLLVPKIGGEYGANLTAMASLNDSLWPTSLAEVEYILRIGYQMPDFYKKTDRRSTIEYRSITVQITLTHLTDGQVLYSNSISGQIPEKVLITEGSDTTKSYFPTTDYLIKHLNDALSKIGGSTGIEQTSR